MCVGQKICTLTKEPASAIRRAFDFKSSNPSSIQQVGNSLRLWQIKHTTSISLNYFDKLQLAKKQILTLHCLKGNVARINWSYDMHVLKQMGAHTYILYYATLQPILKPMTSSALTLKLWQSSAMDQQQCQGQDTRDCVTIRPPP